MSVHRRGKKWQVKWKLPDGQQRSRTFDRKSDADLFDREIKRRKQLGPHLVRDLDRSAMTFAEFIAGPWRAHAAGLARHTRQNYRWALSYLTELYDEPLVAIDVPMLAGQQRLLLDRDVPPQTVRAVLSKLAALMQVAAEHGLLPANGNPVRSLRKVSMPPREPKVPFAPVELERLIAKTSGRNRAILVLGSYLGLRPREIRLCPWKRLDGDRFTVEQVDTKPRARPRTIEVPQAARVALAEWRLQAGRPGDDEPIIGPLAANTFSNHWNTWLKRAAGRDDVSVYTLRHTHASLLHYANYTLPEAAERMGHTQAIHVEHYAHVLEGLRGVRYADLDTAIAAFRAELGFPVGSQRVAQGDE